MEACDIVTGIRVECVRCLEHPWATPVIGPKGFAEPGSGLVRGGRLRLLCGCESYYADEWVAYPGEVEFDGIAAWMGIGPDLELTPRAIGLADGLDPEVFELVPCDEMESCAYVFFVSGL